MSTDGVCKVLGTVPGICKCSASVKAYHYHLLRGAHPTPFPLHFDEGWQVMMALVAPFPWSIALGQREQFHLLTTLCSSQLGVHRLALSKEQST
jgi:hypothetical protein